MPWRRFSDMIFDSATKYEPEDRHLTWQESIYLSGVTGDLYERAIRMLTYCTLYVNHMFNQLGFNLWDIKWEISVDGERLVIVDTIDPDSIRVTSSIEYNGRLCFIHFNKQAVRDYYRIIHADWYNSINDAKKRARLDKSGRDFLTIYREGVASGHYPGIPQYDEEFSNIQSRKYAVMVEPLLKNKGVADIDKINNIMRAEIDLYKHANKLKDF